LKTTDNTPLDELDRFTKPAISTMIDRYVLANHWTKGKTVIDAATGKGYGAGILLSLGAESVVGIDIDKEGIEEANNRFLSPNCRFIESDI
jgi:predicted RNA methylase